MNRSFQSHDPNNTAPSHEQIQLVDSFSKLMKIHFKGQVNAACWFRTLDGDFSDIVQQLQAQDFVTEYMTEISTDDLNQLQLSPAGQRARQLILQDLRRLTEVGASPVLNLIKHYERDEELEFIATDVYSFHVDRSPVPTHTFLCTYHGAVSDILPNSQAQQKILVPEIRDKLRAMYDGPEQGFESFLREYYFDLHYQPAENAQLINLGLGHLWKLAVDHPDQASLPCIHRAPVELDGEYRLLLIC